MAKFTRGFIDSLNNASIETLLDASGVKLSGSGSQKLALCISASHDDKNPSMSVNLDTGAYHCHGCGVGGGGCIDMFASMEGLDAQSDFKEVVLGLSAALNVEPVYTDYKEAKHHNSIKETLFTLAKNSLSTPYFDSDRKLMDKFTADRGITQNERNIAKLGFMPSNVASSPFAKANHDILMEAGVLKESKNGKIYSPFSGRVIFPITDEQGSIIAIAGRIVEENPNFKAPKYINSNETAVFKKSNVLYGLYNALKSREEGQKKLQDIYVVEGYMDAITCQAFGLPETVATMGTAATNSHLKKLSSVTDKVTFIFDPDEAGKTASTRAMLTSLPFTDRLDINFVMLPTAQDGSKLDPDTFIRQHGVEPFKALIKDHSQPINRFAASYVTGQQKPTDLMQLMRSGIDKRGKAVFDAMPEGITRNLLSQDIANNLSKKLDMPLSPEQLGMAIESDLVVSSLKSDVNALHRQLAAGGLTRQAPQEPETPVEPQPMQRHQGYEQRPVQQQAQQAQQQAPKQHGEMPESFLINTQPKEKDLVTNTDLKGRVLVVEKDMNNNLSLFDHENNQRHKIENFNNLMVVKPAFRIASKMNSRIAKIGQPIFKAKNDGEWLSSVPMEWLVEHERNLPQQQQPQQQQPQQQQPQQAPQGYAQQSQKQSVMPFTMECVSGDKPSNGDWVMMNDGGFAKLEESTNGATVAVLTNGNIKPNVDTRNTIKIEPKRTMPSRHNGENHKKGDLILLMGKGWHSNWTPKHYDVARQIVDDPKSFYKNREVMEYAAILGLDKEQTQPDNLQASLSEIRTATNEQLISSIGMDNWGKGKANVVQDHGRLPASFLVNDTPKENDLVTSTDLKGRVMVVEKDLKFNLLLHDHENDQRHKIENFNGLTVINPEFRTVSKINSKIAKIGQPIFKAEKNGEWLSDVPEQWLAEHEKASRPKPETASPSM